MEIGIRLSNFQGDWPRLRSIALRAEQAGFSSVQVSDHLLAPKDLSRGVLEGWTTATAVAALTTTTDIGMVICQGFRNPALLAKMVTALDLVSNERLRIIVGAGYHEREFTAFGYEFSSAGKRVSHLEEAIQVLRGLFDSKGEPFNFDGRFITVDEAVNLPVPTRRIPIAVGGTGPRMLGIAARHADEWNVSSGNVERYEALSREMDSLLTQVGRSIRKSVSVAFTPGVDVPSDSLDRIGGTHEQMMDGVKRFSDLGVTGISGQVRNEQALDDMAEILPQLIAI